MSEPEERGVKYYTIAVGGFVLVLLLLPLILPCLAIWPLFRWVKGSYLKWQFRRTWGIRGRVGVFVYSESPNWQSYVEANILPRIADRAVILNWSERAAWRSRRPLEVRVFDHWAGDKEFNPIAIVFRPSGKVLVFRFWEPFKALKHGKPDKLHALEKEMLAELGAASTPG